MGRASHIFKVRLNVDSVRIFCVCCWMSESIYDMIQEVLGDVV